MADSPIVRTGVFATEEEAAEITRLFREADNAPVMTFVLDQPSFTQQARHRASTHLHRVAMSHGLRDHRGFYGFDESNREFIAPKGWTP